MVQKLSTNWSDWTHPYEWLFLNFKELFLNMISKEGGYSSDVSWPLQLGVTINFLTYASSGLSSHWWTFGRFMTLAPGSGLHLVWVTLSLYVMLYYTRAPDVMTGWGVTTLLLPVQCKLIFSECLAHKHKFDVKGLMRLSVGLSHGQCNLPCRDNTLSLINQCFGSNHHKRHWRTYSDLTWVWVYYVIWNFSQSSWFWNYK